MVTKTFILLSVLIAFFAQEILTSSISLWQNDSEIITQSELKVDNNDYDDDAVDKLQEIIPLLKTSSLIFKNSTHTIFEKKDKQKHKHKHKTTTTTSTTTATTSEYFFKAN